MRDFHRPGRSAVFAQNGICATSHPLAAQVAIETLKRGGNAVDAAVAGALVLGLAEPQMTGLGGDCFALIKPAGAETAVGLNASGRAPAALDAARLRAEGHAMVPLDSPHAVTVPGAVAGFLRLLEDHGRLGREAVLAPAIHYAAEGIPVAPRVAADWATAPDKLTGAARDFFLLNGAAPRPGDVFRAPGQAEVLKRIAAEGAAGFYQGPVAEDMVESLRALGGLHRLADFAAVAPEYVEPVSGRYRDAEIVELPPNGQGVTALLLARLLEGFDIASLDPFGAMRTHLEIEATKLAYDARNRYVADPGAGDGTALMLDETRIAALARLIDPERALPGAGTNAAAAVHQDTVYITVVDADRMAVSLIYSIFHSFGSGLASCRYGINFHNRGAGFVLTEGHPNELGPNKRPLHTIIPGMMRQGGRLVMPFGVMGGQYQATGHVRLISNMVDFGLHPQAAIDAPRSFFEDGAVVLERGYEESVIAPLEAKGHAVRRRSDPLGGAQAIRIDHERGVLEGASDPRKDGIALGY